MNLIDVERAWAAWTRGESFDWKHLPNAGGLNDQEEELMHDLIEISGASTLVQRLLEEDRKPPSRKRAKPSPR